MSIKSIRLLVGLAGAVVATCLLVDLSAALVGSSQSPSFSLNTKYASAVDDTPRPLADRLVGAVPNPFNPRTTIKFEVAANGPVDLRLYDMRGRLVRILLDDAPYPVGAYEIPWDGRNDHGGAVATGVYLCRFTTRSGVETARMTLIR
jgi:hypothetical protein